MRSLEQNLGWGRTHVVRIEGHMHNLENYSFEVATAEDLPEIVRIKLLMFAESGHADLLVENAREVILT